MGWGGFLVDIVVFGWYGCDIYFVMYYFLCDKKLLVKYNNVIRYGCVKLNLLWSCLGFVGYFKNLYF